MFTKAFKGEGPRTIYADGKKRLVKIGGDLGWRNNNPGNIRPGAHSRIHGSIGTVDGFSAFPTLEDGKSTLIWLLKKRSFREKTVYVAIDTYAPQKDSNNPDQYRKSLQKLTNLDLNKKIKDLSEDEFNKLVSAIQRIEGNKPGTQETFYVKAIIDVETNKKNIIVAYLIEKMGWKSKPEVIDLIGQGRVAGVIVKKNGNIFIRTRPDQEIPNNLEAKKPRKRR